jgi:hypothetical protein
MENMMQIVPLKQLPFPFEAGKKDDMIQDLLKDWKYGFGDKTVVSHPSNLAIMERAPVGIPPNTMLIFELDTRKTTRSKTIKLKNSTKKTRQTSKSVGLFIYLYPTSSSGLDATI